MTPHRNQQAEEEAIHSLWIVPIETEPGGTGVSRDTLRPLASESQGEIGGEEPPLTRNIRKGGFDDDEP